MPEGEEEFHQDPLDNQMMQSFDKQKAKTSKKDLSPRPRNKLEAISATGDIAEQVRDLNEEA